ncbi:hypothetical protein KCU61_g8, partial [Aureobasidium melanogenum]
MRCCRLNDIVIDGLHESGHSVVWMSLIGLSSAEAWSVALEMEVIDMLEDQSSFIVHRLLMMEKFEILELSSMFSKSLRMAEAWQVEQKHLREAKIRSTYCTLERTEQKGCRSQESNQGLALGRR